VCDGGFCGVCGKADGPFPTTRKTLYSGGNLTVFNLGKEDHGVYECVAASVVSSVITSTLLIIERTLRYVMSRDRTDHAGAREFSPYIRFASINETGFGFVQTIECRCPIRWLAKPNS